jgi:hypothetical protein
VPCPLGFVTKGTDGRIDDPMEGGRAVACEPRPASAPSSTGGGVADSPDESEPAHRLRVGPDELAHVGRGRRGPFPFDRIARKASSFRRTSLNSCRNALFVTATLRIASFTFSRLHVSRRRIERQNAKPFFYLARPGRKKINKTIRSNTLIVPCQNPK